MMSKPMNVERLLSRFEPVVWSIIHTWLALLWVALPLAAFWLVRAGSQAASAVGLTVAGALTALCVVGVFTLLLTAVVFVVQYAISPSNEMSAAGQGVPPRTPRFDLKDTEGGEE